MVLGLWLISTNHLEGAIKSTKEELRKPLGRGLDLICKGAGVTSGWHGGTGGSLATLWLADLILSSSYCLCRALPPKNKPVVRLETGNCPSV